MVAHPRTRDRLPAREPLVHGSPAAAFQKMQSDAPDLAAPFLFAMGKTLTARIRADNKRFRDAINFARTSGR